MTIGNKIKTTARNLFIENKWTSSLIIFSVLAVLMILWRVKYEGGLSWNLSDPAGLILNLTLPIIVSSLYIVYRFVADGRLEREKITEIKESGVLTEAKKSVFNLASQLALLYMIAAVAAFLLYYSFLFALVPLTSIAFVFISPLILLWWVFESVSSIKSAMNRATGISPLKKLVLMFLAFLSFYSASLAVRYIRYRIYENERADRESVQFAEIIQHQNIAVKDNGPTVSPERTLFYSVESGDIPASECNGITDDPVHSDAVFLPIRSYYCSRVQWVEPTEFYYRFLYDNNGIYISPPLGDLRFELAVPQNWFVDEEKTIPQDEGNEWLRIGVYTSEAGKINLSNIGAKVFYRTTSTENFSDFVEEIKSTSREQGEITESMQAATENTDNLDRIVVKYPDNATDMYVFLEPGKYILFQNAYDFIINSLERN